MLIAIAIALVSLTALIPRPTASASTAPANYVVFFGSAGLRWDDVNPADTPHMWALAQHGSIGALSVTSARRVTCSGDGWLTLGSGNLARYTDAPTSPQCPPLQVEIDQDQPPTATLPQMAELVTDNENLPYKAAPGALGEASRCTSAIGPGAALAAARPYGRVDRYSDTFDYDTTCALSIVDLGEIAGTGAPRQAEVRQADKELGAVLASRPQRALVVVAGLSDVDSTGRLHVAIADGPGFSRGWLTSSSTVRPGYVQLIDLAPTMLAALDRPVPTQEFAGAQVTSASGRPASLPTAVGRLADADAEASVQRHVGSRFFTGLTVADLVLFVVMIPLLRRARRPAGPVAPKRLPRWLLRTAEVLLSGAALTLPAALIADVVPWWRWDHSGLVFLGVTVSILIVATTLVSLGTHRGRAPTPLGGVAAVGAGAVAIDVLTGARLQLNGVAGYSALAGGRYAGVGVIGLGVIVAGVMLGAGALAQTVNRRWRPVVIAIVGAAGVVLVGSPYLGADASGAVALAAGVCTAVAMGGGGWLSLGRLVWAGAAALGVAAGFAVIDVAQPVSEHGSVGRLVDHVRDGTATFLFQRIGESNFTTVVTSPLTLLVIGSALFTGFVLLRTWGGLKRVMGLYPSVRAALAGTIVATILAGVIEAVGFNVLGAALATAVPLATLAALRVLEHADYKTVAEPKPGAPRDTVSAGS